MSRALTRAWPATLFALAGALLWICAWLGGPWWGLEVLANFVVPVVVVAALTTAACAWLRAWPGLVLAMGVTVHVGYAGLGWWVGAPEKTAREPDLRVLVANVLRSNATPDRVRAQVREADPDLVLLQEISTDWQDVLDDLADGRPHTYVNARQDNFGLAVLSRWPLEELLEQWLPVEGGGGIPAVWFTVTTSAGPLRVGSVHVYPPAGAWAWELRADHLAEAAAVASEVSRPLLVAGDLNTSMSTRSYRDFAARTGLRNGRAGRGWLGTWPAEAPGWLRIPLDHVLHSEGVSVDGLEVLPSNGSDHLALLAEVSLSGAAR